MECAKIKLFKVSKVVYVKEKCRLVFVLHIPLKKGRGLEAVFQYESYQRVKSLLNAFRRLNLIVEELEVEVPKKAVWLHQRGEKPVDIVINPNKIDPTIQTIEVKQINPQSHVHTQQSNQNPLIVTSRPISTQIELNPVLSNQISRPQIITTSASSQPVQTMIPETIITYQNPVPEEVIKRQIVPNNVVRTTQINIEPIITSRNIVQNANTIAIQPDLSPVEIMSRPFNPNPSTLTKNNDDELKTALSSNLITVIKHEFVPTTIIKPEVTNPYFATTANLNSDPIALEEQIEISPISNEQDLESGVYVSD